MGDYQQSTTVNAPADALFDYLSDVSNLPDYFTGVTEAVLTGAEQVHVKAELADGPRESEAFFTVDEGARKLAWGSEGHSDYHGDLQVHPVDDTTSSITISLHTERVESEQLEQGLQATLDQIRQQVEHGNAPSA